MKDYIDNSGIAHISDSYTRQRELEQARDNIDKLKAQIRGLREYTQEQYPDDVILRAYINDILK